MANVVNVSITDTFILRDNSNVAITGKVNGDFSAVEAYAIATPATTASVTLTEIGAGEYRISFTPTTPTTGSDLEWTAHLVYNSGGVFREFSETYVITAVASTVVVVSSAASGGLTQTLAQLRQRVARRFGDYIGLTATSNGTTTTFIDTTRINTATEDMKGRALVLSDGSLHFVSAQVDATGTLTFTPSASATFTLSGAAASVYNKRGKGFLPADYDAAINDAINDAFPLGLIEVESTIAGTFDASNPDITVPASLYEVHTVSWQDTDGFWHDVRKSRLNNEFGWEAQASAGTVRILGSPAWLADTFVIKLVGYGRQGVLSADSDACVLNAEYIVTRACYHLAMGNIDKDPKFSQTATTYMNESQNARKRLRRLNKTDSTVVRAY